MDTENIACRAELGRYPLSIDIKASICSYWQRLKHSTNNVLLREAFQYVTKNTPFFNIQQNEEINKKCKVKEPLTQQHIKNARLVIKKTSGINIYRTGLKPRIGHQQFQEKNLHTGKSKIIINLKNN